MSQAERTSAYTEADLAAVAAINKWIDEDKDRSRSALGKLSGLPSGTISQVLSGKYPSSPSGQIGRMQQAISVETERSADGVRGYVKGSVFKLLKVVCDRTRKHASFGIISGHVGVGKTSGLKEYCLLTPMTLMVEANPSMTPGVLLCEFLKQLNIPAPAGLDNKLQALLRALKGTAFLLIADEAEKMSASSLEYLRRIRDKAGVGVVLSGTEKLTALIQPEHGQFDQIRSRVGMWPPTVTSISRDDADEMARVGLAEFGEIGDDILDALWGYGAGSARVLMEGLINGIRDYPPKQLTAAYVAKVAADVLFMSQASRKGARR